MINMNLKILVEENFQSISKIVIAILKQLGYKDIDEAEDSERTMAKLRGGGYGFLMTGWNNMNMDGLTLLQTIHNDPVLKDLLIMMLTAESGKAIVVKAIHA
jgi:two-component system, chemotaxis family, chemotaxis protein CheY